MGNGSKHKSASFQDEPIAIVGMASQFPEAGDLFEFWNNIAEKRYSIQDVDEVSSETYWDKKYYFDPDPQAPDKTYAHQAGFIKPIEFDPLSFKIPPVLVESISTAQLFALHVAKQAVIDAGMDQETCPVSKDKVGVILGGAGNGNTSFALLIRQQIPVFLTVAMRCGIPEPVAREIGDRLLDSSLSWNEDSFPGFLGNVACGRIASYFDFGGTSSMVDAACASSHAAIKSAIYELRSGSCDAVLTGGVNLENSIFSFMCFSKTPALSRAGICRPFDKDADGMLLGDGVGILVLKRLADAQAHGDRIYAVIQGIEASSDGRAKSIFAPRDEGQIKALERAYQATGIAPNEVELIEAHGTGTASGDDTELNSLHRVYSDAAVAPNTVAVGSIKSQIGHTRCAAGAASLMKVALALHHKVLPPTINVTHPAKIFQDPNTPFYVNAETRPWIRRDAQKPRTGGVSAFGFGGTNYHILVQEYQSEHAEPYRIRTLPEVVVLHAETPSQLLDKMAAVREEWQGDKAATHFQRFISDQSLHIPPENARLTFTALSVADAVEQIGKALDTLTEKPDDGFEHPRGIYYQPKAAISSADEIVMLFPGQGSQYVEMARDVANNFPELRTALHKADQARQSDGQADDQTPVSSLIYPIPKFNDADKQQDSACLTATENAQPALAAISAGYVNLLSKLGVQATKFAGHSFGEITALWASGGATEEQLYRLAQARGQAMRLTLAELDEPGAMAAVAAPEQTVLEIIQAFPGLSVANCNSPQQTVIAGDKDGIMQAVKACKKQKIKAQKLNVSAAFHSPFVAASKTLFAQSLAAEKIKVPDQAFYSNVSGQQHATKIGKIRQALADQLACPVRFVEMIETIYRDGGRLFIEAGPKGVLSKLTSQILGDRAHQVVSVNPSNKGDHAAQLFMALAKLVALGVELKTTDPYRLRPPVSTEKGRMAVHLDGGNYVTPQRRELIEKALDEDHQVFQHALEPVIADALEQHKKALGQQQETRDRQLGQMEDDMELLYEKNHTLAEENSALKAQLTELKAQLNAREPVVEVIPSTKPVSQGIVMSNQHGTNQPASVVLEQLDLQKQVNQVHSQFQTNQMEYIKMLDALFEKQHRLLEKYADDPKFDQIIQHMNQSVGLLDKNQAMYHVNHEQYFQSQRALTTGQVESGASTLSSQVSLQAPMSAPAPSAPVQAPTPASAPTQAKPVSEKAPTSVKLEPRAPSAPVAAKAPEFQPPTAPPVTPAQEGTAESTPPVATQAVATSESPGQSDQPVPHISAESLESLRKVTEEELCQDIVELVSHKTGYPEDMVEIDMDLEADLGIDSIKRIEIFGALFEELTEEGDQQNFDFDEYEMDDEDFDPDDFSTIRKIAAVTLKIIEEIIAAAERGEIQIRYADGTTSGGITIDAKPEAIEHQPESEPEPKEAAQKAKPPKAPPENTVETEEVRSRTMQLGFVASTSDSANEEVKKETREETPAKKPQPQPDLSAAVNPTLNQAGVLRLQAGLKPIALPDQQNFGLADSYVWLVAEYQKGVAKPVVQMLRDRNQNAVTLTLLKRRRPGRKKVSNETFELVGIDEADIASALGQIEERAEKKIGGFIFVEGQAEDKPIAERLADDARVAMEQVFFLAKPLRPKLIEAAKQQSACFMVAVRNDGCLGTSADSRFSITNAGLTGLVKSLGYEWPEVNCRFVDVSATADEKIWLDCLRRELADPSRQIHEVGYNADQQRQTKRLKRLDTASIAAESSLNKTSVVLVTGGARGITAQCIEQLAQACPATYLLVGRTPLADAPDWSNGETTEAALKPLAMAHLQAQGDKPTPVAVNQLIGPILNQQTIRANIDRISQTGAKVEYVAMDVQDQADVAEQIELIEQRWGRITGLVHAAGNLADKKIEQKTPADFQSVFATKIDGLAHLLGAMDPSQLKHLILFSSVSGYFGNAGQTDYSSANEVLSGFAHQFQHQFPDCFVRALNWGPWDGGMVNATLKKAYEARGLVLISMQVGTQLFVDEFATDPKLPGQVLVGGWEYRADIKPTDLLGESKITSRQLEISANPVLRDHAFGGNLVLPATYGLEWLVSQTLAYFPGYFVQSVRQFEVLNGVMLTDNTVDYAVSLTRAPTSNHKQPVIQAQVSSVQNGKPVLHYRAEVGLSNKAAGPVSRELGDMTATVEYPLPIYHNGQSGYLFHGPAFQGLERIIKETDTSLLAACKLAESEQTGQFDQTSQLNPTILDICLQAPYLWLRRHHQQVGLPLAIGELKRYDRLGYDQPFVVDMQVSKKAANTLKANIQACGLDGKVCLELLDVQFTVVKSLTEEENRYLHAAA